MDADTAAARPPVDRAAGVLGWIGVGAFLAIALATIADVLLRWLMGAPIDGFFEIYRLWVAVAAATFFPLALIRDDHITIRFLGAALGRRASHLLDLFGAAATFVFFTLVGWQFLRHAAELADSGETTWTLAIPTWPWWSAATVFLVLCVPAQLYVLVALARGRRRPGNEAEAS